MQKGGVKNTRDKALCAVITNLNIKDWTGKAKKIDANSEGKGVIEIELAKDIVFKTWNNEFSDMSDHTLIKPDAPLFQTASSINVGAIVKFSGNFFSGAEGDCIEEGSISLAGKLDEPEFIFRFQNISSL